MEKEKETEKKKKKQGEKEVLQFYIYKLPIDRPAAVTGIVLKNPWRFFIKSTFIKSMKSKAQNYTLTWEFSKSAKGWCFASAM